jgi:hypothetical protein
METLELQCPDLPVTAKTAHSNALSSRRPSDTKSRIVRLEEVLLAVPRGQSISRPYL